ncbi:MAG: thioredoxin-like domain-containing protein [Bacteroidota bacterium]
MSCNQSSENSCGSAWIGGEVVNPKKDYVIIWQSRKTIDTVPLDENNFFLYQFEHLEPGMYFFSHNEYQALFVEPGDSIMLRVNTMEFDESLSYTGKGASKNNFMMELFLLNEKENELMPSLQLLSPKDFEFKMDSFAAGRQSLYNEFTAKKNPSEGFKVIANAAINYDIYTKKELYISTNLRKKVYNENVEIPESFYGFRQHIDLGNTKLRSYYPYYRYLRYYMDNLAYEAYKGEAAFERNSFVHNYHKIKLFDSLVTDEYLKNSLIRTSAIGYFLNAEDEVNSEKMLAHFLELNTSAADREEVAKFAMATMKLMPGHTIPNVMLLTSDNTVKDLHSTLNRPTVLYFWSNKSISHYKKIHTRANDLRNKFPEYVFVGINIDGHFKKWLKAVQSSGYNELSEYQFENFKDAEQKLIIDSVNKAMIVDGDGVILNGNTNIFDTNIESELLGFLNQ